MATHPLPGQLRRSRSTSTSSSSSTISSSFSPFHPSSSSSALIPFKWERTPGIPKTPLKKPPNTRRVPALPLPPPLRTNSDKVARVADVDPFAAAIVECVKDPTVEEAAVAVNGGGAGRRRIGLGLGFGLLDRYGSCKTSCAVSECMRVLNREPTVRVRKPGRVRIGIIK